jgi:hypothetical protein
MTKCNLPQFKEKFNIHNVFSLLQNKYINECRWGLDNVFKGKLLISRLFIFFTAPVCIGNVSVQFVEYQVGSLSLFVFFSCSDEVLLPFSEI